ncbi:MAG: DNA repair protein RecO [Clostridia bacterium]|nr:DNA repair protein RecO [Clostridia bacterium]
MNEKLRGLILRETNLGEADKILTVLTEKDGKISVLAKNIRRVKGRFGAGATFLCYSDLEVSPSNNELYFLKRATPIENFFALSEDIEKLTLATYFGQLASYAVPECFSSDSETLSLLLNTFYMLCNTDKDLHFVKSVFEMRLMAEEGYAPLISGCAACGNTEFPLLFNIKEGYLTCPDCGKEGIELNASLFKALQYILHADIKKLYNFSVGEESLKVLSTLTEQYCIYRLGRELPALDYLKSVIL